tara:strand:- start:1468 stop:3903 length:2436 start_codon:yes stop_codon:yes gene_type:complete
MIPGSATPFLLAKSDGDFKIERSLRFNSNDSAYLNRTPSSAGNRKTFTWSGWVKRSKPGSNTNQYLFATSNSAGNNYASLYFGTSDNLSFQGNNGSGSLQFNLISSAIYRDVSAWYHIVLSVDSTQSTSSDRIKLYVNGQQLESFGSATYPSQNFEFRTNSTEAHGIGFCPNFTTYFDGYLADVHFIDGQQLAATDFGEYDSNNVWQPKAYSGANGTNGFYLDFSDNSSTSALGNDAAGSNNWTANNFSVASGVGNDSLIDSPSNYEASSGNNGGNYATFNPLYNRTSTTFSNGNLQLEAATYYRSGIATISLDNGKWYYEAEILTNAANGYSMVGVTTTPEGETYPGGNTGDDGFGWYSAAGSLYPSGGTYSTWTTGDVVSVAYDSATRKTWIAKNGTWQNSGDPAAGTGSVFTIGGTKTPYFSTATGTSGVITANFGQRPFSYTPPTGFLPLVTTSLSDPTIADGRTAMNTSLYTGNGSTNAITGVGHSPDILWIKSRSNGTFPAIADSVTGPNYFLRTNGTNALSGPGYNDDIVSFDSDGFTLGADTYYAFCNTNTYTYTAWTWDAGSSNTTVAVDANGSGLPGAACEYRVNPSTGCSVVKVANPTSTEARVHGLNKKPDLIICKSTGSTDSWHTYHSSLGYTKYINLNGTGNASSSDQFGSQEPTSTYFYVKPNTGSGANKSDGMIYYIWTAVEGYSAFGSYEGNGSSDGPFIYTGFKVAWLLIKNADTSGETWTIHDSTRDVDNPAEHRLEPNSGSAESTGTSARFKDLLSNGFKIRGTSGEQNTSGDTYIYAAFAEHPFKTARAR